MNFTELIRAIQESGLENAEQLSKAITDLWAKEKEDRDRDKDKLTNQIDTLTAAAGIDSGTTEEKLTAASSLVKQLQADKAELQTTNDGLNSQISQAQRNADVSTAATAANASPELLQRLISDEEIKTEGDKVTVAGKDIKAWATETYPGLVNALFIKTEANKLPTSPAHAKPPESNPPDGEPQPKKAVDRHIEKFYKKPDFAI